MLARRPGLWRVDPPNPTHPADAFAKTATLFTRNYVQQVPLCACFVLARVAEVRLCVPCARGGGLLAVRAPFACVCCVCVSAYQGVCSPSRASLLTGRYPDTTHITDLWCACVQCTRLWAQRRLGPARAASWRWGGWVGAVRAGIAEPHVIPPHARPPPSRPPSLRPSLVLTRDPHLCPPPGGVLQALLPHLRLQCHHPAPGVQGRGTHGAGQRQDLPSRARQRRGAVPRRGLPGLQRLQRPAQVGVGWQAPSRGGARSHEPLNHSVRETPDAHARVAISTHRLPTPPRCDRGCRMGRSWL